MKVRILSRAETEIEEARIYFESCSSGLGSRFLREVRESLNSIAFSPESFPTLETAPGDESYRRKLLAHFRYAIVFEIIVDEIIVVAVAHTSREPNYWLEE